MIGALKRRFSTRLFGLGIEMAWQSADDDRRWNKTAKASQAGQCAFISSAPRIAFWDIRYATRNDS
jgi:hypothetical protein